MLRVSSRGAEQIPNKRGEGDKRWCGILGESCNLAARDFLKKKKISTLPLKLVELNGQVCDFNEIPEVLVRPVVKTKPGCQKQTCGRAVRCISWCCQRASPQRRNGGQGLTHVNPPSWEWFPTHLYWLLE